MDRKPISFEDEPSYSHATKLNLSRYERQSANPGQIRGGQPAEPEETRGGVNAAEKSKDQIRAERIAATEKAKAAKEAAKKAAKEAAKKVP